MRRAITVVGATAALVLGGAATATAEPPGQPGTPLVCDNGQIYNIVLIGNGAFTPGLVVDSTAVLVPTAFGPVTTRTVTAGSETIETSDPTEKGGGGVAARNHHSTVNCSFDLTIPVSADTTVFISGTVTAFITGRG